MQNSGFMIYRRNIIYILIIVCLLAALPTGRVFFYQIAYVLAITLGVSLLYSWTTVNWLRMRRWTYLKRLQVGDTFEERFIVRNRSIIPKLWLEVHDHSTLPNHNPSHVVPFLRRGPEYQWETKTPCVRRGQFDLGPITVISGDPFGFYQFPRHINATSSVLVYPPTVDIHEFIAPSGRLSGGAAVRRRTFEVTPNAAGVREYSPGDSLNRIHWKSSARRAKLMVKEFELDPLGDVWIFLDLSQSSLVSYPSVWGGADYAIHPRLRLPPSTEEYGIVIASSLTRYFIDQGRTVGFLSYTPQRNYIAPDRGDRQYIDVLEVLALASSESDYTLQQMLSLEKHQLARGTTLVIVTSTTQTDWLAEAYAESQRGITVVVVLVNPGSFGRGDVNIELLREQILSAGIMVYVVNYDDDLSTTLSYRAQPVRATS
jgi:uncharacterized protein (DUF58 family)